MRFTFTNTAAAVVRRSRPVKAADNISEMSWYPPSPLELLAGAWQLCEGQASDGAHVVRRQGRAWVRRWPVGRLVVKHQISLLLGHNPPLSVSSKIFSERSSGGRAGWGAGVVTGNWDGTVGEVVVPLEQEDSGEEESVNPRPPNISEEGDAVNRGSVPPAQSKNVK